MKRRKKGPKLSIEQTASDLRRLGYQPVFEEGRLIEWRRVNGGTLHTAKVTVHTSGRITISRRSSNATKAGRKRDRGADHEAPSEAEASPTAA